MNTCPAASLALASVVALGACGPGDLVVTSGTVAGTKTGALEGISIVSRDDLDDRDRRTIVDIDILHQVVVEPAGPLEVIVSSELIPRIHAVILGAGSVAMDLKVLDIELSDSPDDPHLKSIGVDQLVFVKQDGEWVLVLQMTRNDLLPEPGSTVNAYQYVSYPASVADDMTQDEAIIYVDLVLDLASQAQRL